ncbi:retrovirus-related pol polyprotein from transposon TNT 1-94 [Tanacetum coccineum]
MLSGLNQPCMMDVLFLKNMMLCMWLMMRNMIVEGRELNRLTEDFRKRFSPQQELSAEQAFWFRIVNPSIEPSYTPPVIVDVPSELPKVFKDQFESIKHTRVRHKEQCDSLINKLNLKSVENEDLKAQIQDKVFVITSLKNKFTNVSKLDVEPLPPRLLQTWEVHITYLRSTPRYKLYSFGNRSNKLRQKQPLDSVLGPFYKYTTRIQELLVYVQDMCPNAITPNNRKVDVTPMNNIKKVRFAEPHHFLKERFTASKTKSWLWHRRLSHLNFGTLNKLAKDGLARGIPRLKFQKDHLCSACALGKSKKSSHQPKAEDTNQEKL